MGVLLDGFLKTLKSIRISAPGDGIITPPPPVLPGRPSNVTTSDATTDSFKVNYTPASDSTSHEYSLDGASWQPMPVDGIIRGLSSLTAYSVRVRGVNADGPGPASDSALATTLADLPGAITNVTISEITTTSAKITHTGATKATSYQYSLGGAWFGLPSDGIITGLVQNTSYTVSVRGVNADGAGPATAANPFQTLMELPGAISAFVIPTYDETTATTTFNDAQYATSYSYSLNGGSWQALGSDRIIRNLTKGTAYAIKLRGENAAGSGPETTAVNITTLLPLPGAVDPLTVSDLTDTSAKMNFSNATDATFYQYSRDDGATWLALGSDRIVRSLTANTSYVFRVRAGNATGYGPASNAVAISTAGAYATFNPARTGSNLVLTNNNLTVGPAPGGTNGWRSTISTVGHKPSNGILRYAEFRVVGVNHRIILDTEPYDVESIEDRRLGYYTYAGSLKVNFETYQIGGPANIPTPSTPAYIGILWSGSRVWIYANGNRLTSPGGQGYDTTGVFGAPGSSTQVVYPIIGLTTADAADVVVANFGSSPWQFPPDVPVVGWN